VPFPSAHAALHSQFRLDSTTLIPAKPVTGGRGHFSGFQQTEAETENHLQL